MKKKNKGVKAFLYLVFFLNRNLWLFITQKRKYWNSPLKIWKLSNKGLVGQSVKEKESCFQMINKTWLRGNALVRMDNQFKPKREDINFSSQVVGHHILEQWYTLAWEQ